MKKSRRIEYYLAGSIAAATFFVYLPSLRNGFVNWDDNLYIYDNNFIRKINRNFFEKAFFGFADGNWHPLTWLSHALDYAVWGLNPMGHHLTSVIIHSINTFLVVVLITRLLEAYLNLRPASGGSITYTMGKGDAGDGAVPDGHARLIAAGITGLLFGIHPIHVESVAWAAERKDVLCGLFFLLSVLAYTNYAVESTKEAGIKRPRYLFNKMHLLSLCFFALALMSKPMAVSLPLVLLVLDWHPFKKINSFGTFLTSFAGKIPFFVFSLVSSIVTIKAQRSVGATGLSEIVPLPVRAVIAAKSLIAYLWKMILTLDLVPIYPYPRYLYSRYISFLSFEYIFPSVLLICITALCLFTAKKQRLYLASWCYYAVTLGPVLGLVQVGNQSMADRYAYLPSLGPFLVAGLAAAWIWRKMAALKRRAPAIRAAGAAAVLIAVLSMSYMTVRQIGVWKNSLALWNYIIEKIPLQVPAAYNNRGLIFLETGQTGKALADFSSAISIDPTCYFAWFNRGNIYKAMGKFDLAASDYGMAAVIHPSYWEAYINRGIAFEKMGQTENALTNFGNAIAINPASFLAHFERGNLYAATGRPELAIEDYNRAIASNPRDSAVFNNRGFILARLGQTDRALHDFDKSILLNADNAQSYTNRGSLYLKTGNLRPAISDFGKACGLGDERGCDALRSFDGPGGPRLRGAGNECPLDGFLRLFVLLKTYEKTAAY